MGGMFSKKKVAPQGAPRTNSAPAAMEGLRRLSHQNPQDILQGRPASALDMLTQEEYCSGARQRPPGGFDATAVAALRPFEKRGHGGKQPSGVVPEGSEAVSLRSISHRTPPPPVPPNTCSFNNQRTMITRHSTCLLFFCFFSPVVMQNEGL